MICYGFEGFELKLCYTDKVDRIPASTVARD